MVTRLVINAGKSSVASDTAAVAAPTPMAKLGAENNFQLGGRLAICRSVGIQLDMLDNATKLLTRQLLEYELGLNNVGNVQST